MTLDADRYPTDFARRKWAEQRSAELWFARLDAREGVVPITLADAIDRYLKSCKRSRREHAQGLHARCRDLPCVGSRARDQVCARDYVRTA